MVPVDSSSPKVACDEKLRAVLEELPNINPSELRRIETVERLIQRCGLVSDARGIYGDDENHQNSIRRGVWQIPRQLGEFAILLSHKNIRSFIEIGTFSGGTFTFLMGYLTRFNPQLKGVTVDIGDGSPPTHLWNGRFDASFVIGSSKDFVGYSFDLCLIDGCHSYAAVANDYLNVGCHSKLCAFHDINDELVERCLENNGGVPRFWKDLQAERGRDAQFYEFLFHSRGRRVMGIGVVESARTGPVAGKGSR